MECSGMNFLYSEYLTSILKNLTKEIKTLVSLYYTWGTMF